MLSPAAFPARPPATPPTTAPTTAPIGPPRAPPAAPAAAPPTAAPNPVPTGCEPGSPVNGSSLRSASQARSLADFGFLDSVMFHHPFCNELLPHGDVQYISSVRGMLKKAVANVVPGRPLR